MVVAIAYEPPALGAEVTDHRRLLEERGKALTDEALASLGGRPTGSCTARPCPSWWFLPPPEPSIHKMVGER